MVAPRVYAAMAQNVVGHLDPFFFEVAGEIRSLLGYAYSTKNQFCLAISGTGSAGMETAVANFAEPGRKFALLSNGFFADRIGEMARRQGAAVVKLSKEWGQTYDAQEVRDFIRREQPHLVGFVQAETSTGMFNQAKPICEAAHEAGALTIADCVTSLGGMPVMVDENGIDIAYSCTQKGLGCPPGLSPMTVSPRALDRLQARGVGLDQLRFHIAAFDGDGRASERVDLGQLGQRLFLQRRDLARDFAGAVENVAIFQQVGLIGHDLLHAQRPLLIEGARQAERLVPGRQLHRAGSRALREHHREHLDENARDVVFRLLLGEAERIDLHAIAETAQLFVRDAVALEDDFVPKFGEGAHFA